MSTGTSTKQQVISCTQDYALQHMYQSAQSLTSIRSHYVAPAWIHTGVGSHRTSTGMDPHQSAWYGTMLNHVRYRSAPNLTVQFDADPCRWSFYTVWHASNFRDDVLKTYLAQTIQALHADFAETQLHKSHACPWSADRQRSGAVGRRNVSFSCEHSTSG